MDGERRVYTALVNISSLFFLLHLSLIYLGYLLLMFLLV